VHILIEEMIDLRDTQWLFDEFVRRAEPLHDRVPAPSASDRDGYEKECAHAAAYPEIPPPRHGN
jgi:hypothetical protein